MFTGQDIICISSIDWDFIWQGHQEIMSTFAKSGNRVLFIENTGVRTPNLKDFPRLKKRVYNWLHSIKGIRKQADNLYVYAPIVLPFPYSRLARVINKQIMLYALKRWVRSMGFSDPIIWTFLPTGLVLDIIGAVDHKLLVYYCIDNFAASSPQAKKIERTEDVLIEQSDLVFVTAKSLYDRCIRHNPRTYLFPYGVNMDVYERARDKDITPPADMAGVAHPIVGYIGGVHKWLDVELIRHAAVSNPKKSFIFVGPKQIDVGPLDKITNIRFLGQKKYEELPLYVAQFDVCLIPYLITEYTKNVYPTKVNEYMSLGKPVVATPISEILAYNKRNDGIISVAGTKEDFSRLIDENVKHGVTSRDREKRISVSVKEGSWSAKIEDMCKLIVSGIAEKEKETSVNWKENLLMLYKKSRGKLAPAIGSLLAVYVLLFYTPFVWMAAKPLKITSQPDKANAVLVLSGGVGESGKAGQGYEERTQYAVDLYKKGYAPKIVFSTGYRYLMKEAEVMKVLAVSLGVPENAISLEETAANTYENIVLSKKILKGMGAKRVIVISSPYHMLRVSLVCHKVAPDIDFIYAPIPHSIFFGDEKDVKPRHILAILHEYISILYYRIKGYV